MFQADVGQIGTVVLKSGIKPNSKFGIVTTLVSMQQSINDYIDVAYCVSVYLGFV